VPQLSRLLQGAAPTIPPYLRDGSFGVVTPIQNQREKRLGFTCWKFAER
jgi:hypothetical protein